MLRTRQSRQRKSSGFSLIEVLIAACILALTLLGVFSSVQLVDKTASIVHENRKQADWHAAYIRERALNFTVADTANLGVAQALSPTGISPEASITVLISTTPIPGLYSISSTLTWQNMTQAPQASVLATLAYLQ